MGSENISGLALRWAFAIIVTIIMCNALVSLISAEKEEICPTCGGDINAVSSTNYNQNVNMDIEPGACPNVLSLNSQGLLPVAILGTKDFDVKTINTSTIILTRENLTGKVAPFRWHYEDIATPATGSSCVCQKAGLDSHDDLILEFDMYKIIKLLDLKGTAGKKIVLTLKGNLLGSNAGIMGNDCINIST